MDKFNWDIKSQILTEPTIGFRTPFKVSESNSSDTDPPNLLISCILNTITCQWPVAFIIEVEDKVMSPIMAHWERLDSRKDYVTDFYNRVKNAGNL